MAKNRINSDWTGAFLQYLGSAVTLAALVFFLKETSGPYAEMALSDPISKYLFPLAFLVGLLFVAVGSAHRRINKMAQHVGWDEYYREEEVEGDDTNA